MSESVRILIISNDSSDGTDEMIAAGGFPGLPIRYEKWPENVGAIRNFLRLVELSQSDFCWFLSDDDAVVAGMLQQVVDMLTAHPEIGGILLKSLPCDRALNPLPAAEDKRYAEPRIERLPTSDASAYFHDWGLLSVCVFRVDMWHESLAKVPLDKAGAYPHVWVQADMMRNAATWGRIDEPAILWRGGNDSFLAGTGAIRRALMAVESYGNMAIFFGSKNPLFSKVSRDMSACFARHYLKLMKSDWCPKEQSGLDNQFLLISACLKRGGWKSIFFYSDALPALLVPRWALDLLRSRRKRTTS